MKKILFSFFLFFLATFSVSGFAEVSLDIPQEITEITEKKDSIESISIIDSLNLIDEKKALLSEKENFLEIEGNKEFLELQELIVLEEVYIKLQESYTQLKITPVENISPEEEKSLAIESLFLPLVDGEEKVFLDLSLPEKIRKSKDLYTKKKEELENTLSEKKKKSTEILKTTKEEIQQLSKEIELLLKQRDEILKAFLLNTIFFIGIFLLLILIQSLSNRFLQRIGEKYDFSDQRIRSLKSLKKVFFNTLYIIILLVFFSAQFLSILPFLAILGTAIAFALRDILSSFIAWFIIGTKEGYKEGDIIEVGDDIFGEVVKISSFLTEVQERGMNGATGKYITFPNKKIFEGKIKHFLKRRGFLYVAMDFYLTEETNLQKARDILLEVMKTCNEENILLGKKEEKILKSMGIKVSNMEPKTFLNLTPQGVFVRGKLFVHFNERYDTKTKVIQMFIKRIQEEEDIHIRFLNT